MGIVSFIVDSANDNLSIIADPQQLIATYLGGTPLAGFFNQKVSFCIPTETRFEHHHILAGYCERRPA